MTTKQIAITEALNQTREWVTWPSLHPHIGSGTCEVRADAVCLGLEAAERNWSDDVLWEAVFSAFYGRPSRAEMRVAFEARADRCAELAGAVAAVQA